MVFLVEALDALPLDSDAGAHVSSPSGMARTFPMPSAAGFHSFEPGRVGTGIVTHALVTRYVTRYACLVAVLRVAQ